MQNVLKFLRTVQLAMLVSIGLYAFIAARYGPASRAVSVAFVYAITAMAAFMVVAILLVRRTLLQPAQSILAEHPEDAAALNRWRTAYILTFALSEAVALYGIVLRFIGVGFQQVILFFLAGSILMLSFGPRRPSTTIG